MGLFDRFKPKKKPSPQPEVPFQPGANTSLLCFFDRDELTQEELAAAVTGRFGAGTAGEIDRSHPELRHLTLTLDGREVLCSLVPAPYPGLDLSRAVEYSLFVGDAEQQSLIGHRAFCLLTEIGGGSTLAGKREVCLTLTRLCGALMELPGAAGVWVMGADLLLGPAAYQNYAALTEEHRQNPEFFAPVLWVRVNGYEDEDGAGRIYTQGLRDFGFPELEFYKPTQDWAHSYEKLYLMSLLQITGKEVYRNMDTIAFAPGQLSVFKQDGEKLVVIGGI